MKLTKLLIIPLLFFSGLAFSAEQVITPSPLAEVVTAGQAVSVKVDYSTANPEDNTLSGLGLRIHWDSSKLTFDSLSNVFATSKIAEGTPQADGSNFDGDASTDMFLQVSWADTGINWPNTNFPQELFTANFTVAAAIAAGVTTSVNFSASSVANGFTFDPTSATKSTAPPVMVPDVVGLSEAAADAALAAEGLTATKSTAFSDTVATGSVISQDPVAGTEVADGSAVAIVLSLGPAPVTVPDVVGSSEAAADATLAGDGFTVTKTSAFSNTVALGNVISQNPAAGSEAPAGSAVAIVLSLGPAPVAPDVVGLSEAAADAAITAAGLTSSKTTAFSDTVAVGNVISQEPAAGTEITDGSAVAIVISLGVAPATVPNVVGLTEAAADAAIAGAGLTVSKTTAFSDTVATGLVISQDPTAGTEVADGSNVAVVISLGVQPVSVPDVVGSTEAAAEATLTGLGLTVTQSMVFSDTVAAGLVISQDPAADTEVQPGSAVALVISKGPEPDPVPVPDVAGMSQADAEAALEQAGLVPQPSTEASDTVAAGNVIRSNPAAATPVAPGSTVVLVVSSGPTAPPTAPIRPNPHEVPTLSFWGLLGLSMLMPLVVSFRSRKRK